MTGEPSDVSTAEPPLLITITEGGEVRMGRRVVPLIDHNPSLTVAVTVINRARAQGTAVRFVLRWPNGTSECPTATPDMVLPDRATLPGAGRGADADVTGPALDGVPSKASHPTSGRPRAVTGADAADSDGSTHPPRSSSEAPGGQPSTPGHPVPPHPAIRGATPTCALDPTAQMPAPAPSVVALSAAAIDALLDANPQPPKDVPPNSVHAEPVLLITLNADGTAEVGVRTALSEGEKEGLDTRHVPLVDGVGPRAAAVGAAAIVAAGLGLTGSVRARAVEPDGRAWDLIVHANGSASDAATPAPRGGIRALLSRLSSLSRRAA